MWFLLVLCVARRRSGLLESWATEESYFGHVELAMPHERGCAVEGVTRLGEEPLTVAVSCGLLSSSGPGIRVYSTEATANRYRKAPRGYMAEGIAVWNGTVYQLPLEGSNALAYPLDLTYPPFTVPLPSQAGPQHWGVTVDHTGSFWVSDGTQYLQEWRVDPPTSALRYVRKMDVGIGGLNDIEALHGTSLLLANKVNSKCLLVIDTNTARVQHWITLDLTQLERNADRTGELYLMTTVNGIADGGKTDSKESDPLHGRRLFITGKNWEHMYRIRVTRQTMPSRLVEAC